MMEKAVLPEASRLSSLLGKFAVRHFSIPEIRAYAAGSGLGRQCLEAATLILGRWP